MAQREEPMDLDSCVCDFDNKENLFQHSNVLPTTLCIGKGQEELDVSELNMKLRYYATPSLSPMCKSYTANCIDNKAFDSSNNIVDNGENIPNTMNSAGTRKNSVVRHQMCYPLHTIPAELGHLDTNRNALRPLDSSVTLDNNVAIAVSTPNEIDKNHSLPSSSSFIVYTPEATTPNKENLKDGGSPIMRGLKSVINMFRPSQILIPLTEDKIVHDKAETLSPPILLSPEDAAEKSQAVVASTLFSSQKTKDAVIKGNSLNIDSLVFNKDLDKELQWKDPDPSPGPEPSSYHTTNELDAHETTDKSINDFNITVINRLLSLSANNSAFAHETTVPEASTDQNEADHALTQHPEPLADQEINVYILRSEAKELKDRLSTMESEIRFLENMREESLKNINELTEKLNEKTKHNNSMAMVIEEYEKTIASVIAEIEQNKKRYADKIIQLIRERDEQTTHLASVEVSFSDLHSKYKKSKQIILRFKTNEEMYKMAVKQFEDNLSKMQNNYELLKTHATSKLNDANEELQKMNRAHEAKVLKLNAMIKRKELHITSLEEIVSQQTKAIDELTAICDELINKVSNR